MQCPVEVRLDAGEGRGKGVFATRDIKQGDVVFRERPLVSHLVVTFGFRSSQQHLQRKAMSDSLQTQGSSGWQCFLVMYIAADVDSCRRVFNILKTSWMCQLVHTASGQWVSALQLLAGWLL